MQVCQEKSVLVKETPILVVGGGKGGVGKTCFTVNLAIEIARRGWRVVLLDADLSCSNVDTVLGFSCDVRLDDFFRSKSAKALETVIRNTPYDNLQLIPGTSGLLDVANPRYQQKAALIRELKKVEADLVLIDLDAGAHLNTLDFYLLASRSGVVIITPERTSIDNAFKFLRAGLFRNISRFYGSPELALLLKENETLPAFLECVRNAGCFDDATKDQIVSEITAIAQSMCPHIVVNKVSNGYEAKIAANILAKYVRTHLMMAPELLGHMYFDNCVSEAVNSGVPFVVGKPNRKISACIADMANRLGYF